MSTSSALASIQTAGADTVVLVAAGVLIAVTGVIALMGLGFAIRHIKKYITGRKF